MHYVTISYILGPRTKKGRMRLEGEKMSESKSTAIIKTASDEIKVADMTAADLECAERVNALVALAKEANDAMKRAKALDKELADNFKRLAAEWGLEPGQTLTSYNWEDGYKLSARMDSATRSISPEAVLAKLYENCGEEEGNKAGKAWHAWCEVTDPVTTRELNPQKLEEYLKKASQVASGDLKGTAWLSSEDVAACVAESKPRMVYGAKAISKDEKALHDSEGWAPVTEVM